MRKDLIVLQEGSKDCGASCLLSIIRYYGGDISKERLIELTKTDKEGTNFYSLAKASSSLGLVAKSYKVDEEDKIKKINEPFIAQMKSKNSLHFVVVYKVGDTKALLMDPSKGKVKIDLFDFTSSWTGNIMLFEKIMILPKFKGEKQVNKIIISTILKNKSSFFFFLILSLIFTIFSILTSFYSQTIFDKVIDTTTNNLIVITILFSVLYIVKIITNFFKNYLVIYLNQKLDASIIISAFTKVVLLPYYYYKNKTTGEVLSRINDLFSVKGFLSKIIVCVFLDTTMFIAALIILYFISSKILFALLLICLLYVIILLIFNYPIKTYTRKSQEEVAHLNSNIIETVSGYETVKNLNIESNIILRFSKTYTNLLNNNYKRENMGNILLLLKQLITDIGLLMVNYLIIRLIMNNTLKIGTYMTITLLSNYLLSPIQNMINLLNEYHYIKGAIIRANSILDVGEEDLFSKELLEVNGNIIVNNLHYTYNNKINVLNGISFYIKSGDKVLIIGSSGSGKSTILKLIYKYYKLERDKIFINGNDINDYSISDIRKNITYISQNESVFTSSIRDNIILDRNISEEAFLRVAKLTYVDEIIKDNMLGYDYLLEENATNISGGQRQRIILARGILKSSNIIMIDEGLNEIDVNLERKILVNLFEKYKEKTFIIVSHRKDNMDLYNRMITLAKNGCKNYERGKL